LPGAGRAVHDLGGKVAMVTGVGSVGEGWGNGRATATLLARAGAQVFGVDTVAAAAEATQRIIAGEGNLCHVHLGDMRSDSDVQSAVAAAITRFGRIDILVNNVGGSIPGGPLELAEADWDEQIALNLKTTFLGCKHVLPGMIAQRSGAIVNVASIAGIREYVGRTNSAYSAAKAAVIALSRSLALRHAGDGVRCNTVIPGLIHTPLVEHRLAGQIGGGDAANLIAERHAKVPMGHMGDAWDVANAILYLASDEARYVTAAELVVDGGLSATTP
jgi:NAD(P)-dependent dehydrogenase (short-subunit alcohol dehydrogenase family)